jgi:hypothetical protein
MRFRENFLRYREHRMKMKSLGALTGGGEKASPE